MTKDGRTILGRLLPALLVLGACDGTASLGSTDGAAGTSGAAGTGAFAGTGAAGSDAGGAGVAGTAGTTGAAGSMATGDAGTTGTAGGPPDSGAPEGGAGTSAPPGSDAGLNPEGGTPLPPYDGGVVNVINASNWDETTIHPFSKRRMLVRDEGDPHVVLLDFGNPTPVIWRTVADGAWARGLQLIGNNQVLGSRHDGYEIFDLTTGQIVKTIKGFGNTQGAYRTANGETMMTLSGTTLAFLDKTDRISHSISYPGYGYVRMVRPTRNRTFLVPNDTKIFEGDANGNVLWTATGTQWGHVWEPLLMSDGNVLLATAFGSSLDVVDRTTHMVTKRYGTKNMPMAAMIRPNFFAEFQILPNGNFITSNWQGKGGGNGGSGIQVLEFNPAGDLVWFYKQDPTVFGAIQGVQVIDGMDPRYLHVQEISPDSTWQPVIPTP